MNQQKNAKNDIIRFIHIYNIILVNTYNPNYFFTYIYFIFP